MTKTKHQAVTQNCRYDVGLERRHGH